MSQFDSEDIETVATKIRDTTNVESVITATEIPSTPRLEIRGTEIPGPVLLRINAGALSVDEVKVDSNRDYLYATLCKK